MAVSRITHWQDVKHPRGRLICFGCHIPHQCSVCSAGLRRVTFVVEIHHVLLPVRARARRRNRAGRLRLGPSISGPITPSFRCRILLRARR